jgi:hypothetical protein
MMSHFMEWLLPKSTDNALARGRAGLVVAACLGLAVAMLPLLLIWRISGDLEVETAAGILVFILVLAGIAALARRGRGRPAAWALIVLLTLLITATAASFGLGSPSAAAYSLPVVLAACTVGLGAGIGVASFCSLAIWIIAWGTLSGWYQPFIPAEPSHLTYSAPLYTVLLLLVALIVGAWSRYVISILRVFLCQAASATPNLRPSRPQCEAARRPSQPRRAAGRPAPGETSPAQRRRTE